MKPIERRTAISLVCWYKFPDIFAESANKHRSIVMMIITLKILLIMMVASDLELLELIRLLEYVVLVAIIIS